MDEEIKKPIPRIEQEPQAPIQEPPQMISVISSTRVYLPGVVVESNIENLNRVVKVALNLWKQTREKGFRSYVD